MATKPNLLSTFANQPASAALPAAVPAPAASAPAADDKTRQKVFRITLAQEVRLKEYCAHNHTTIQDAVLEGLNMLFKAKGLPPLE